MCVARQLALMEQDLIHANNALASVDQHNRDMVPALMAAVPETMMDGLHKMENEINNLRSGLQTVTEISRNSIDYVEGAHLCV